MTARAGMSALIADLRSMTAAGTADYSLAGTAYWSDTQLQTVLDKYRTDVYYDEMTPIPHYPAGGGVEYLTYRAHYNNLEDGTAITITDPTGGTVGTSDYTLDAPRGIVTFGTDRMATGTVTYYLTGQTFDPNSAAADVWNQKASHYVTAYDFSTDNHNLRRGQIIDNCLKMAKEYTNRQPVFSVNIDRSDTDVALDDDESYWR
jgi:hypothetical protein